MNIFKPLSLFDQILIKEITSHGKLPINIELYTDIIKKNISYEQWKCIDNKDNKLCCIWFLFTDNYRNTLIKCDNRVYVLNKNEDNRVINIISYEVSSVFLLYCYKIYYTITLLFERIVNYFGIIIIIFVLSIMNSFIR
jgi:hypothetical protein